MNRIEDIWGRLASRKLLRRLRSWLELSKGMSWRQRSELIMKRLRSWRDRALSKSLVLEGPMGAVRVSSLSGEVGVDVAVECQPEARLIAAQSCPARLIRSSLSLRELKGSLALQAESLLPGPVEAYAIGGWCRTPGHTWIFFAPKELIDSETSAMVLPGSLGAVALPDWLSHNGAEQTDGLWGYAHDESWVIALIEDAVVTAIRVLPAHDTLRLSLIETELASRQNLRWIGAQAPPCCSTIASAVSVAEELAAMAYFSSKLNVDLAPQTLTRRLQSRAVQQSCVVAAALFTVLAAALVADCALTRRAIFAELGIAHDEAAHTIEAMQREIRDGQSPFAAESTLPKVAEVLCWLGGLPELRVDAGVRIKRMHYQLTSWPTAGNEKQPYRGRVTVEIVCPETMLARQILERISADSSGPIDHKTALEWNHNQGTYRLSFQLANRKVPLESVKLGEARGVL